MDAVGLLIEISLGNNWKYGWTVYIPWTLWVDIEMSLIMKLYNHVKERHQMSTIR